MPLYALKIICKEAKAFDKTVMTPAGTVVWACTEDEYPSSTKRVEGHPLPCHIMVFDDKEVAQAIADGWEGHPWFYEPEKVEVVMIEKAWRPELIGYKIRTEF